MHNQKTPAELARTKEEHGAAVEYHKERAQLARSEGRSEAACNHDMAATIHQWAVDLGPDALMKLPPESMGYVRLIRRDGPDGNATLSSVAQTESRTARKFEMKEEYAAKRLKQLVKRLAERQ